MSAATEALIHRLAAAVPAIGPTLREHLADNDKMLPHVLLDQIAMDVVDHQLDDASTTALLSRLEAEFGADDETDELIAVSFLETLPYAGDPGDDLIARLGPKLTAELNRLRAAS